MLHSLLLIGLILGGANGGGAKGSKEKGDKDGGKSAPDDVGKILPKDGDGEPKEIEVTLIQRTTPKEKTDKPGERCKDNSYYGGVGLMQEAFTGKIIEVPEGYPAQRAGIQVGDIIISNEEIKGPPGTVAVITIARGVEIITFEIVREKICAEQIRKP